MKRGELVELIRRKRSFLCIGLDTDLTKVPGHLLDAEDPIFEFNKAIIDATIDVAVAYKPNLAFYECYGTKGWESLTRTIRYIRATYPGQAFTIADAKRGDIGNTSQQYARAMFDPASSGMEFDSVTVAPYMGEDSVKPFLSYPGKWIIVLAVVIAMITLAIGDNAARAFSLVGALAIVRFRSVVEDPRDTAFVILAVAVGLAVGAGFIWVPVMGLPIAGAVAWAFAGAESRRAARTKSRASTSRQAAGS